MRSSRRFQNTSPTHTKGHYSVGNVQTLDLINAVGDATAFCRSNIS